MHYLQLTYLQGEWLWHWCNTTRGSGKVGGTERAQLINARQMAHCKKPETTSLERLPLWYP